MRPYLLLMQSFVDSDLEAKQFCAEFMKLWKQKRDETLSKKREWPEPYDEQLIAAFQRGDIGGPEFSARFAQLWGYNADFQPALDFVFSACDCWYPHPEREGEIGDEQLRQEVRKALATLKPGQLLAQA